MNTQVSIIGCGPIGLAASLLLAKFGVRSVVLDRRTGVNVHPRSRFVDSNTMELFRSLGVAKEIEKTGLPPEWTEHIFWLPNLSEPAFAAVTSPTFETRPRASSPCLPVMTAQDLVEQALMAEAEKSDLIEILFEKEVVNLNQSADQTLIEIKDVSSGEEQTLRAEYTIGADGPGSRTRNLIGSTLHADPRDVLSQDVIFHADLKRYVTEDKQATLLYVVNAAGVVIFQPLDGDSRWRCQITLAESEMLSEDAVKERIRHALGTTDSVPMDIVSMGMWRPTPGCTDKFYDHRIFLAGDAAHISVPTGGMGNNTGFLGIRNLAWKLALVLNGWADQKILESYEQEHRPIALERIAFGVQTTEHMTEMIRNHVMGSPIEEARQKTQQYADHDGVLLGYRVTSPLIAQSEDGIAPSEYEPQVYIPRVKPGHRAPHIWLDEASSVSLLDQFGAGFVLVIGAQLDHGTWKASAQHLSRDGFPIRSIALQAEAPIYRSNELVLVRPDGVVSDCWAHDMLDLFADISESEDFIPALSQDLLERCRLRPADG